MTLQTIEIDAEEALSIVQKTLPVVEAYIPMAASAAGPIGLGVSAAGALLGLLSKIPTGLISDADQQSLADRIAALQTTAFKGPEWNGADQRSVIA